MEGFLARLLITVLCLDISNRTLPESKWVQIIVAEEFCGSLGEIVAVRVGC